MDTGNHRGRPQAARSPTRCRQTNRFHQAERLVGLQFPRRLFQSRATNEFFKITPLTHALILIVDDKPYEKNPDFQKQRIRVVRTGFRSELSQPTTFGNLTIIDKISKDEVVTTLPEAVRFWPTLDGREGTLREKRNERVLDDGICTPREYLIRWYHETKFAFFF